MGASTGQTDLQTVTASSRDVTVGEFRNASESFCTGTAAELVPIGSLATGTGEEEFEVVFPHGTALPGGPVTVALLKLLREVMTGKRTHPAVEGWLREPWASPEEFCK